MLAYKPLSKEPTLLYWTLVAATYQAPHAFINIWHSYKHLLSIQDFRRHKETAKHYASPHWLLASLSGIYPSLYLQFLERFKNALTIDDFTEEMTDPAVPQNQCSVFGLLAHGTMQNPEPFYRFWSTFSQTVKANMLINKDEIIAGQQATPINSLCQAIEADLLDCSILHFCFRQLGDLRPCHLPYAPLSGDIIEKNGSNVVLFNIRQLLTLKNKFFDVLSQRIQDERYDSLVLEAAQYATQAGFHNAYYFLALFYKHINQEDKAYDVLRHLPVYSIYHNPGLNNCITWYLKQAYLAGPHAIQKDYYKLAFYLALRITDPTKQPLQIQAIAYHFMHEGKLLATNGSGPLSPLQVKVLQDRHDVDALLKLLKSRKAAKIYQGICDDILKLPFEPTPTFVPAFTALMEREAITATQEESPSDNQPEAFYKSFLVC